MKKVSILTMVVIAISLSCCIQKQDQEKATGKLFIIGGGNRTDAMMNELVNLAGIR